MAFVSSGSAPQSPGDAPLMGVARWSLRLRIFLFFALLAAGGVVGIAVGSYLAFQRYDPAAPADAFVLVAILGSFVLAALTTWIWFLFDENVAKPLVALAGDLRSRAHANVADAIDAAQARYLGDLAPAASAVSEHLADTRAGMEAAVERERERIEAEHHRLEAILRDAPNACLLCNQGHRVALYNRAALEQVGAAASALGLGRSVFEVLAEAPIRDALDRLVERAHAQEGGDAAAATELLCTTRAGDRAFQAQMRLFSRDAEDGYLLTFRDVTQQLTRHGRREALLRDVFDTLQRPAANLLSTIEALEAPGEAAADVRAALQKAVVAETQSLALSAAALRARYETEAAGWWPMADTPARDLMTSVRTRLEAAGVSLRTEAAPMTLRCDGFAIAQLLGAIALDLAKARGAADILLSASNDREGEGLITLSWAGDPYPISGLDAMLGARAGPETSDAPAGFTMRDALRAHGADIWPERADAAGRARLSLPLPLALSMALARGADAPAAHSVGRSVFHDLRLLAAPADAAAQDLSALNYVVFDTETTGLNPDRGDEIVQIAAVRIVAGRLLTDDRFETLVDPERPIPAVSTEIHGVTAAMVAGAPTIDEAGRRFHAYCGDSVLIAHNAPFDLAFLKRHAGRIGATFDHPVLDTALMSAILFGGGASHNLDAIAERLGAPIDEAVRHTALGDAVATAEAAARMIAMMRAIGVRSLADYQKAAEPHQRMLGG